MPTYIMRLIGVLAINQALTAVIVLKSHLPIMDLHTQPPTSRYVSVFSVLLFIAVPCMYCSAHPCIEYSMRIFALTYSLD